MDQDALARALREAFATDLADHVGALEEGLLALERAPAGEEGRATLRDVFRSAHGLKGAARAAGLGEVEALCHAMESLLGEARDAARALDRDDFAALLAAVDALAGVERALRSDPGAQPDVAPADAARERVSARLTRTPAGSSAPGPTEAPPPTIPSSTGPGATHAAASRGPPGGDAAGTGDGRAPPEPRPQRPPAPPDPPRAVRIPFERLDALATAGSSLLLSAREIEAQAGRLEGISRELRRLRRDLRGSHPAASQGSGADPSRARPFAAAEERLRRVERDVLALRAQLAQDGRELALGTRRLEADVRGLRLVPWQTAVTGLDRVAHDVAAELGKDVELVVEGPALELDQSVVSALREPLAHVVRNAVDHGLESPDERRAAGKPPRGRIVVSASVEGGRACVRVRDDGRGLDPDRLREAARRRGLPVPSDDADALDLVFLPGFSTSPRVTAVSGRGVGLDVVATAVRAVRGAVSISTEVGRHTQLELVLPATLYAVRALVVRDGGQAFALPALDVDRILRVRPDRLSTVDGRPVLLLGVPVPVAPLLHAVGLAEGPWKPEDHRLAVVLAPPSVRSAPARRAREGALAAVLVEDVVVERELSLQPLGPDLAGARFVAGAALLTDREVALVLRPEELLAAVRGHVSRARFATEDRASSRRRRILLADDAATTRALERSLLEAAGYDVLTAADGDQAFALLQQRGADLVVSDVEMPGRDGFELTRAIRGTARHASLPVVLLTGRQSDEDRRRGLDAGADAYLLKGSFDQRQLLQTVAQLLGGRA